MEDLNTKLIDACYSLLEDADDTGCEKCYVVDESQLLAIRSILRQIKALNEPQHLLG